MNLFGRALTCGRSRAPNRASGHLAYYRRKCSTRSEPSSARCFSSAEPFALIKRGKPCASANCDPRNGGGQRLYFLLGGATRVMADIDVTDSAATLIPTDPDLNRLREAAALRAS